MREATRALFFAAFSLSRRAQAQARESERGKGFGGRIRLLTLSRGDVCSSCFASLPGIAPSARTTVMSGES